MSDYICPNRFSWLKLNHLSSFDQIWSYPAEWFEEPNSRRGGWSGVGRIAPQSPETGERGVFLKRQESHVRRTLRHPFSGEPTFACEFRMMRFLHAHGVPAPVPVFFGERLVDGKPRAILMTEELAGYKSLEEVSASLFTQSRPPLALQRALIRGVAETVKKLHVARIQHRSLYPKHLFVSWPSENDPQVAVIDLEKSRFKLFPMMHRFLAVAGDRWRLGQLDPAGNHASAGHFGRDLDRAGQCRAGQCH